MGSGKGVSDAPTGFPGLGFPPSHDISAPQTHNLVLPSLRVRLTFSRVATPAEGELLSLSIQPWDWIYWL